MFDFAKICRRYVIYPFIALIVFVYIIAPCAGINLSNRIINYLALWYIMYICCLGISLEGIVTVKDMCKSKRFNSIYIRYISAILVGFIFFGLVFFIFMIGIIISGIDVGYDISITLE